jgi:hypothetical protein
MEAIIKKINNKSSRRNIKKQRVTKRTSNNFKVYLL